MEPEPMLIGPNGALSDAALHAPMVDDNPRADALFIASVIREAIASGVSVEEAWQLYGPRQKNRPDSM